MNEIFVSQFVNKQTPEEKTCLKTVDISIAFSYSYTNNSSFFPPGVICRYNILILE